MKNIAKIEPKSFVAQVVGSISLICTLFLAGKAAAIPNYDLVFIAVCGLYFCAKWRFKGCLLALVMLGLSAVAKHLFYTNHHVWQCGFEVSVAVAWIITTLVFHESGKYVDGVSAQNVAQSQTIEFLEDDLSKFKVLSAQESQAAFEKITQLQAQLDEALTESSSYQILNDVLRKSTARAIEEKELLISQGLQSDRRSGQLLSEIDVLQKELGRIGDESSVVQQNGQLFKQLNESRVKEAQTHLVNETLARMHRSENERGKELEAKNELLTEQLEKTTQEKEMNSLLNEELSLKLEEISTTANRQLAVQQELSRLLEDRSLRLAEIEPQYISLSEQVVAIEDELSQRKTLHSILSERVFEMQELNSKLSENEGLLQSELEAIRQQIQEAPPTITAERETFLLEQLQALTQQRDLLSSKAEQSEEMKQQLQILQTRLEQYVEVEFLYRQLKGNFQEKTAVLHETRVELFHLDTELQTLKQQIEENSLEGEPLVPEMTAEIEEIEQENKALTLENALLNEIITNLMSSTHETHVALAEAVNDAVHEPASVEIGSVKKKLKKKKVLAEQQDLFILDESF